MRLFLEDFTDDEISAINSILAEIGNHTLTTKLIASYAYDLGMSAKEILAEGVLDSLFEYDNQEEQISSLLDNYKLDDLDVYALRCLALFPDGISKGKFQLIDRRLLRHYPDLVKRGLVIGSDTGYQLHQIIREIVAKKFKISTKDISSFFTINPILSNIKNPSLDSMHIPLCLSYISTNVIYF